RASYGSSDYLVAITQLAHALTTTVIDLPTDGVQIIGSGALLRTRQAWPFEMFTLHSLHPISIFGALLPYIQGGGRGIYALPYWGNYWHHNESQIYLGAVAVSLSIAGAVGAWRARHREGMFWSIAAVAGILFAMGKYAGPLAWASYRVPFLNSFRSPNRWWMIVAIAVAVLAGYTVDGLTKEGGEGGAFASLGRTARIAAMSVFGVVASIAMFVFAFRSKAEHLLRALVDAERPIDLSTAGAELLMPVGSALAALLVVYGMTRSRVPARWYLPLLGLLLVDLNLYAAFAPINSLPGAEKQLGSAVPTSLAAKDRLEPHRLHLVISPASGEFNPLLFYGHEMASGYDPLLGVRYKRFSGIDETGRSHLPTMLGGGDRTLDLMNVRYILVARGVALASGSEDTFDAQYRSDLNSKRWRKLDIESPVERYKGYAVFENLNVLPHFWLAGSVDARSDEEQLRVIRGEAPGERFDPMRVALLGAEDAADIGGLKGSLEQPDQAGQKGKIILIERTPGRTILDVETSRDAMLVLSEAFEPGWKASIDGREAKVRRVDYILRGVAIDSGWHRVVVSYAPRSVRMGAVISGMTALLLLSVLAFSRSLTRRGRETELRAPASALKRRSSSS
ncbi:MAG: YfhO family protein, partial [Acidobacteriota bacterium]